MAKAAPAAEPSRTDDAAESGRRYRESPAEAGRS